MGYTLLTTLGHCVKAMSRKQIANDLMLRTQYVGVRPCSSIGCSSSVFRGASCCLSFTVWRDTGVSIDRLTGRWSFEIMLDQKTFLSITKYLDVAGLNLTSIAIGRRPTCTCREAGQLFCFCQKDRPRSTKILLWSRRWIPPRMLWACHIPGLVGQSLSPEAPRTKGSDRPTSTTSVKGEDRPLWMI